MVMSKNKKDYIQDMKETFTNLRSAGLKFNPEICVFGVSKGKILGYIISSKGIRANPDKTKAIMVMAQPFIQKRGVETYWQSSSAQQIHIKIRRTKPPILQSLEGRRQSGMGSRAVGGLQATQKLHCNQSSGNRARTRYSAIAICGGL
jgi:hypothetical protein